MNARKEWLAVEPLFDEALDLEGPEREALIQSLKERSPRIAQKLVQLLQAADGATEVMIDRSISDVAHSFVERLPTAKTSGLAIGSRVGNYRLVELLGEGGTGRVFRARTDVVGELPLSGNDVALKVLLLEHGDEAGVRRFEREMRIQSSLDHPGIASALEYGRSEHGFPFVVMRLIEGPSIVGFAKQHLLGRAHLVRLLRQVCSAVQAAHDQGIIHRDLKPSNILVEGGIERPNPVVLDFGIAREGGKTGFTMSGQILGTPGYMSPEQARGESHQVTARSDVFSLGVLAYELLVGTNPFVRGSGVETLAAVIREPLPALEKTGVGRTIAAALTKSLHKDPERRFSSVNAFGRALLESG